MNTPLSGLADTQAPSDADLIKDTTSADFVADVMEASKSALVLVDFWAEWCGPCKQLTPVLEKVVKNAKGKVKLVKMDIDKYPEIAGQLRVQSIPTVYAFKDGRPVDVFQGALPESQIITFIERHLGDGAVEEDGVETLLKSAEECFDEGDLTGAVEIYSAILQEVPGEPRAVAGVAKCYIKMGDADRAEAVLTTVNEKDANHADISAVRAMIDVERQADDVGDTADLEAKVAANPADYQSRYDLAIALNAKGDRDGATDQLIEIIRRQRAWNDEAARKQLVQFFEAWGPTDEATIDGRQKLSSILFA